MEIKILMDQIKKNGCCYAVIVYSLALQPGWRGGH